MLRNYEPHKKGRKRKGKLIPIASLVVVGLVGLPLGVDAEIYEPICDRAVLRGRFSFPAFIS